MNKNENTQKRNAPFLDLFSFIEYVSNESVGCGSVEEAFARTGWCLEELSGSLRCTDIQALMFALVFAINLRSQRVGLDEIAGFLQANPVNVAMRMSDLMELVYKRLIRKDREDDFFGSQNDSLSSLRFYVPGQVLESMGRGEFPGKEDSEQSGMYGMLASVNRLIIRRGEGGLRYNDLILMADEILQVNKDQPFVKEVNALSLEDDSRLILLSVCADYLDEISVSSLPGTIRAIFPSREKQMLIRKQFIEGNHILVKEGLLLMSTGDQPGCQELRLTHRSLDLFFPEEQKVIIQECHEGSPALEVIRHEKISEKKLFFGDEVQKGLNLLGDILSGEKFSQLKDRMKQQGMTQGIAVLLYGPPGTGKTESVYQLARQTGRDIRQVVISETKSKWFGESEKMIKKVFDDYRSLCSRSRIAPILLFNEADGVLGRRQENISSNTGQVENAIQNIILQELETLDGILIATSNLTGNLDAAFERRFLYKIRFETPVPQARAMIWQEKIPGLDLQIALKLATEYDFSGGQIDNVARKCQAESILYGKTISLPELEQYCSQETIQKLSRSKMGYRNY